MSAAAIIPRQTSNRLSDRAIQNLFIWPTLILLILINVFPLFYSLFLSFTDYSAIARQTPTWIGFANFAEVLNSEALWGYFATTGRYVLLSVGLQILLGFGLAMLVREKFLGSGIVTTLILIPMMLSPVVVGLFWKLMYNPTFGYLNFLLGLSNPALAPDWLASRIANTPLPGLALWSVITGRCLDVEPVRHAADSVRAERHPRLSLRSRGD